MRKIKILVAALAATAAAVTGLVLSTGGAASAATNFAVTTHSYGHYDTTSNAGNATLPSSNGPVWAIDSLNERWTVSAYATTQADGAQYSVLLKIPTGSRFSEFADPNSGNVGVGTGKVLGVLQYDVTSTQAPSAANVPAVQAPNTGLGAVLDEIFGAGNWTQVGGGNYDFTYNKVAGVTYEQSSCTATPHITAAQNPTGNGAC